MKKLLLILFSLLITAKCYGATLTTNLTHYYNFNEAAGNGKIIDAVGTANGTCENITQNVTGKNNGAAYFNGTGGTVKSWINVYPGFNSTSQNYTFSFWVKSDVTNSTNSAIWDSYVSARIMPTWARPNGYIGLVQAAVASSTIATPEATQFHHIVCVFNQANSSAVYVVDNVSSGNFTAYLPTNIGTANGATIGSNYDGTALFWNFTIDDFGFWERCLNMTEISQLYNNGTGLEYPFTTTRRPHIVTVIDN